MRLFVYDHCPYCVRARMPFGIKNVPFELVTLLNDDEEGPISMIGAKMCPILEKEDGTFMAESMDIVAYVDGLDGNPVFAPSANREDLANWISEVGMLYRQLLFPRWVNAPLEEFATEGARAYFTKKKEQSVGPFDEALANTPEFKAAFEAALLKLEPMINSAESFNETLSYDDVDLFGRLRGITLIKDLQIPDGVKAYVDHFGKTTGVPLHYDIAR